MATLNNIPDELFAQTFNISLNKLKTINSYKQLSQTNKPIITAKRDNKTNLWEVEFHGNISSD